MAGGAWGPQPHQIGNPAYFRSGGGPKLLARIPYFANATSVAPAGATTVTIRAVGGGGNATASTLGGGAAFARTNNVSCSQGTQFSVLVGMPGANSNTASSPSVVSKGGIILCRAAGGRVNGGGGLASDSIGDVINPGGNGNQPGTNGGQRGDYGYGGGGGSGGERNAFDMVILGGDGAPASQAQSGYPIPAGFPGGGGATDGASGFGGAPGIVFIDYWSA